MRGVFEPVAAERAQETGGFRKAGAAGDDRGGNSAGVANLLGSRRQPDRPDPPHGTGAVVNSAHSGAIAILLAAAALSRSGRKEPATRSPALQGRVRPIRTRPRAAFLLRATGPRMAPRAASKHRLQDRRRYSHVPCLNRAKPDPQTMSALEDAVHLLRAAPLSTLLCHWIGSAPFALAAMLFWNDITQYRPSNAACVADSLALAALLAWMNCWRAAFAGRLRAQLARRPAAAHRRVANGRLSDFARRQQADRTAVSVLIVFPLASTVAFYRYAAVLCCRADLSFRQVIAQASKLAGIDPRQNWAALPAVAFLQVLVTLNVATALALLPQLVRMLTGYESIFSRAGLSFLNNPLFAMASAAVGWLAIDPFIQAVYCVMYFRRESLETGEDLRRCASCGGSHPAAPRAAVR